MIDKAALVVLSGGQDSTTCLFFARQYFNEVHAVTFDYGQRHSRELMAASDVAKIAGCASHEIIDLGSSVLKGMSPLTNANEELETYKDYKSMSAVIGDRVEKTFVPMRNALFLTLAANRAVCLGIDHVFTGVCQADNANYPDCRQSFIIAQQRAIREALGMSSKFTIHTPLMNMSKAESIKLVMSMDTAYTALAWTHTAYDGKYPPTGKDHASLLRAQGFLEAGVPDPLVLRAVFDGARELPKTPNYSDHDTVELLMMRITMLGLEKGIA